MPSRCLEVAMDTMGGMSGGPVVNDEGWLVGIVSSSFEGGCTGPKDCATLPNYAVGLFVLRLAEKFRAPMLRMSPLRQFEGAVVMTQMSGTYSTVHSSKT